MSETVILQLPEETLERYRRGTAMAEKSLAVNLVERIVKGAPSRPADERLFDQDENRVLADLIDEQLWEVARARFPPN